MQSQMAKTHLPDGSAVEQSVLRDDCEPLAQRVEADVAEVDAVDRDLALAELDDPEKRLEQRRFASTGSVRGTNGTSARHLRGLLHLAQRTHRPTMPTFSPARVANETPLRTSGRPSR
jgi:hypothetical protein